MNRIGWIALAVLVSASGLAAPAHAGLPFELNARQTYNSVDLSVDHVSFSAQIRSPIQGDQLYVDFDPYVPEDWFVQWTQTSTHATYFGGHAITVPGGAVPDTILVDFFTMPGNAEKGWVDIHVYRVSDPFTWRDVTFALGEGITLPVPTFSFTCQDPFRFAHRGDVVTINAPLRSTDAINDQLIVTDHSDMPAGWFAQYCQTSTHICHFGRSVIPFPAGVRDTLQVDFYTDSTDAVGHYRLKVQAVSNPAIWKILYFGVMTGTVPSSVENGPAIEQFTVRAEPNPLRSRTDFMISTTNPGSVRLEVIDASGRRVLSRHEELSSAGMHRIGWDGRDAAGRALPRGTYFYRVTSGSQIARGKLIISR